MNTNIEQPNKTPNGKVMAGALLLVIGAVLLLKQLGLFFLPDLDFWPLWLVFAGLIVGSKNNFKNSSSKVLIALGGIFFITFNVHNAAGFIWPAAIIGVGIWIILRKKETTVLKDADYWDKKYQAGTYSADKPLANFGDTETTTGTGVPPVEPLSGGAVPPFSHDDILDATAVFGGVNKTIFSKNFKGGDITNIFGGTELDFTHADIQGKAIIDVTQVFGGTKIIVPANWQVVTDMSAIFAGVDDKRLKHLQPINSGKVLILKGVSIFAGLEIRSY